MTSNAFMLAAGAASFSEQNNAGRGDIRSSTVTIHTRQAMGTATAAPAAPLAAATQRRSRTPACGTRRGRVLTVDEKDRWAEPKPETGKRDVMARELDRGAEPESAGPFTWQRGTEGRRRRRRPRGRPVIDQAGKRSPARRRAAARQGTVPGF